MRVATLMAATVLIACLGAGDSNAQAQNAPGTVRRVVTGNRPDGRSYVVSDTQVTLTNPTPNLFHANADSPLGIATGGDARVLPFQQLNIDLGQGGTGVHFWEFAPTTATSKPVWHRTTTLDYDMLVTGEVVLMLDEGEVTLRAGDVLIQRNTHHAWRNPGPAVATVWVVNVALPQP